MDLVGASGRSWMPRDRRYPPWCSGALLDRVRITLVPPGALAAGCGTPCRSAPRSLQPTTRPLRNVESIPRGAATSPAFRPGRARLDASLSLERYAADTDGTVQARIRLSGRRLPRRPRSDVVRGRPMRPTDLVLLTNGRGGMARLCVDLGRVPPSTIACSAPTCTRPCRWTATFGQTDPRLGECRRLHLPAGFRSAWPALQPGPPAAWHFVANAGDGRTVEIQMTAEMLSQAATRRFPVQPADCGRGHAASNCPPKPMSASPCARHRGPQLPLARPIATAAPISFFHPYAVRCPPATTWTPGRSRVCLHARPPTAILRVSADAGVTTPQPEWSENIPHPVEQSRGPGSQRRRVTAPAGSSFRLPKGAAVTLVVTAEPGETDLPAPADNGVSGPAGIRQPQPDGDAFARRLRRAIRAFVVQRGAGKTVVAGYPWFLDWGRDTFICARGLARRRLPRRSGKSSDLCPLRKKRHPAQHDFWRRRLESGHLGCAAVVRAGLRGTGRGVSLNEKRTCRD